MQFQQDWPKDKKLQLFKFLPENLENFRIPARKSCSSHLFGVVPSRVCSDGLRAGTIKCHNFFVLGPILVKFHIPTRLIESFPTIFGRGGAPSEEKLHFTPVHTLRQLKGDEALFPPLRRVVRFRARYG